MCHWFCSSGLCYIQFVLVSSEECLMHATSSCRQWQSWDPNSEGAIFDELNKVNRRWLFLVLNWQEYNLNTTFAIVVAQWRGEVSSTSGCHVLYPPGAEVRLLCDLVPSALLVPMCITLATSARLPATLRTCIQCSVPCNLFCSMQFVLFNQNCVISSIRHLNSAI